MPKLDDVIRFSLSQLFQFCVYSDTMDSYKHRDPYTPDTIVVPVPNYANGVLTTRSHFHWIYRFETTDTTPRAHGPASNILFLLLVLTLTHLYQGRLALGDMAKAC